MYISNRGMLKERRIRQNERVRKENHTCAIMWNGMQRSCKIFGFVPVQRVAIQYNRGEKEVNNGNCNLSGAEKLKGYRPTFHAGPSVRQFSEFRFGGTASTRKVNQQISDEAI